MLKPSRKSLNKISYSRAILNHNRYYKCELQ